MLRVFKLQLQWVYDGDVLAIRVHVLLPRVQGRVLPGGALPFTTIAITTAPVARSPTAAVALTPAAAAAAAAVAVATADDDDDDDDDWRRRAHAAGQRLPVGRQPYTKIPERCWRLQRRNRLRLELDGAHHRRRG